MTRMNDSQRKRSRELTCLLRVQGQEEVDVQSEVIAPKEFGRDLVPKIKSTMKKTCPYIIPRVTRTLCLHPVVPVQPMAVRCSKLERCMLSSAEQGTMTGSKKEFIVSQSVEVIASCTHYAEFQGRSSLK